MAQTRIGQLGSPPARTALPAIHPEWFAGNREQQLARALGITQFGVNHLTLDPGAYSALRHWHEREDEFVFVLTGELVLIDDDGEHPLAAGAFTAFPAGEPNAHHLANRSQSPASYLAIGTRHRGEEAIHYPDDALGRVTVVRDGAGDRVEG
jgi:uncharacterized cupin superfamily protein